MELFNEKLKTKTFKFTIPELNRFNLSILSTRWQDVINQGNPYTVPLIYNLVRQLYNKSRKLVLSKETNLDSTDKRYKEFNLKLNYLEILLISRLKHYIHDITGIHEINKIILGMPVELIKIVKKWDKINISDLNLCE